MTERTGFYRLARVMPLVMTVFIATWSLTASGADQPVRLDLETGASTVLKLKGVTR